MIQYVFLFAFFVVCASLAGGLLPLAARLTHTRLQLYLSFSAGAMLGAAIRHMMPEAIKLAGAGVLNWTAAGLLTLFLVERFFAFHHHESPADPRDPCPIEDHSHADGTDAHAAGLVSPVAPGAAGKGSKGGALVWSFAAVGLAIHSLAGGVALASAAVSDAQLGLGRYPGLWTVFLATFLHKPADALTIVSLMLRSGAKRSAAHAVNLGFSLLIPIGAAVYLAASALAPPGLASRTAAIALAFSAGTFLCIALSDLLPELQFHTHDRLKLTAALLAGFAVMSVLP